jgi:predicted histidine transporter YuiF (NhaC family)
VLENITPNTLPRLLRRTAISALVVGAVAFLVALLVAPPLAAVGVVVGVGLAVFNLRYLDRQIAKVEIEDDQSTKAVRRKIRGGTTSRLAVVTLIVILAVVLSGALGIGIVSGLVLYQIVFVANVFRVAATQEGVE